MQTDGWCTCRLVFNCELPCLEWNPVSVFCKCQIFPSGFRFSKLGQQATTRVHPCFFLSLFDAHMQLKYELTGSLVKLKMTPKWNCYFILENVGHYGIISMWQAGSSFLAHLIRTSTSELVAFSAPTLIFDPSPPNGHLTCSWWCPSASSAAGGAFMSRNFPSYFP